MTQDMCGQYPDCEYRLSYNPITLIDKIIEI